jgi:tripartite-type tricarboxylate transporter receptor subunit TctC
VSEVVNDPAVKKRLIDEGAEIRLMTPAEFGGFMRQENARWVKVVKDAGITPQ